LAVIYQTNVGFICYQSKMSPTKCLSTYQENIRKCAVVMSSHWWHPWRDGDVDCIVTGDERNLHHVWVLGNI